MKGKITIIDGNDQVTLSEIKDNIKAYMVKGEPGNDGISPTATVSKTGDIATITVTDKNGTTETSVIDGYNPTITTTESTGKVDITVDDIDGTATTTISDPVISTAAATGKVDISVTDKTSTRTTTISDPVVNVSKINHVATISVTDKDGTRTTTVADGADLTDGAVPTGAVIGFDGSTIPGGFEEVSEKSIITAGINGNLTMTSMQEYLTLVEQQKRGTELSIQNGNIIIGNGITKVKISANMNYQSGIQAGDLVELDIYRNNTLVTRAVTRTQASWAFLSCSPRLVAVTSGDIIKFMAWENNRTGALINVADTWITVEES